MAIYVFVLLVLCNTALATQQCGISKACSCKFSDESLFKSKGEFLAATVGALSPLLIAGSGFGIWRLIQNRPGNLPEGGWSRENTDVSENSEPTKSGPTGSPATNSTRASSRVSAWSKSTALSLNDMDAELDEDIDARSQYDSPTPNDGLSSPKWSYTRRMPPSLSNKTPLSANSDNLNSWMF